MSSANLITLFVPASLPQLWKDGHKAFAIKVISRSLQCILALIVAILYAVELSHFSNADLQAPAAWIYAEVVASLSLITCALHYFYTLESAWWTVLDFTLCILWTAHAGFFGTIYLGEKVIPMEYGKETDDGMMKVGATIGLFCLVLWLATSFQGVVRRCKMQRKKRVHRKRVDRTIGTLEAHHTVDAEMEAQNPIAPPTRKPILEAGALPTYKQATTEQALARQREALGKYDGEAYVNGPQDTVRQPTLQE